MYSDLRFVRGEFGFENYQNKYVFAPISMIVQKTRKKKQFWDMLGRENQRALLKRLDFFSSFFLFHFFRRAFLNIKKLFSYLDSLTHLEREKLRYAGKGKINFSSK